MTHLGIVFLVYSTVIPLGKIIIYGSLYADMKKRRATRNTRRTRRRSDDQNLSRKNTPEKDQVLLLVPNRLLEKARKVGNIFMMI